MPFPVDRLGISVFTSGARRPTGVLGPMCTVHDRYSTVAE